MEISGKYPISSRQIYLNSKDAEKINPEFTSDCFFFFKEIIAPPTPNIEMLLSVVSASIPMSFYVVNSTNNKLVYNTNQTHIIPSGNYNATELKNELETISIFSSVTYCSKFNKLTFTGVSSFTIEETSSCLKLLGLTKKQQTSSGNTLVGDSVVNLAGISGLYLHTNLLNNNLDSRTGMFSNIIARIPVDTAPNGILQYASQNEFKTVINDTVIDVLRIQIEDDEQNLVQLNEQEWAITLQIDFQNKHLINRDNVEQLK